jgi:hypothetical protein
MQFLTDIDLWLVTCAARLHELAVPCPAGKTHDTIALDLNRIPAYQGLPPITAAETYLGSLVGAGPDLSHVSTIQ